MPVVPQEVWEVQLLKYSPSVYDPHSCPLGSISFFVIGLAIVFKSLDHTEDIH